jgi:hypothetical protein
MTLAASGQMAIAGTVTDRSIQVELGGNGSTQMSMNDTAVRNLGDKPTAGSEINMSTDFYGKSSGPVNYLPISLSGTDTATDTSIPAIITPIDNVERTGTFYWRRVRLTSSQAGSFRLYCNPIRTTSTELSFRCDMQTNMLVVTQGGSETEVPMLVGSTGATGFETVTTPTSTSTQPTSWSAASTATASGGLFRFQVTAAPTGSSGTGRLENFIDTNTGFGYFESSGAGNGLPLYFWMRSPQYTLAVGDSIDLYYGVDCAGLSSIQFYLAA